MPKSKVLVSKPVITYKVTPSFHRYRIKNTYTKFYPIPTLEYTYNHDESFYDYCEYYKWRFSIKFLFYGLSLTVTKDKH
jgi:hypothetical protein